MRITELVTMDDACSYNGKGHEDRTLTTGQKIDDHNTSWPPALQMDGQKIDEDTIVMVRSLHPHQPSLYSELPSKPGHVKVKTSTYILTER